MLNSINSLVNFVQIWQKVISLVTMATNVDSELLTIVFLFLSGTDHSVKVLFNSESVRAGALLEFFGGYRELMLNTFNMLCPLNKANVIFKESSYNQFYFPMLNGTLSFLQKYLFLLLSFQFCIIYGTCNQKYTGKF